MNTDDKYDGVAMTTFKPTNYSCISAASVYLPLSTPWPFPVVNWLACPMLSVWWKVSIEKLESCSVLPSQFTKLAGTTIRDRWYTWLEIYIPVVRDIHYLWQKLARFYTKIAWHQMLGTCSLSDPCSHKPVYVCLAAYHLTCHSPNPFCLTRVS